MMRYSGGGGGVGGVAASRRQSAYVCLIMGLVVALMVALIVIGVGAGALEADYALIAASDGVGATCVVTRVAAVADDELELELEYRLDQGCAPSYTSWQRVPDEDPYDEYEVGDKLPCYGEAPLLCESLLVVYKVDKPSSYAVGMVAGGTVAAVLMIASVLFAYHRARHPAYAVTLDDTAPDEAPPLPAGEGDGCLSAMGMPPVTMDDAEGLAPPPAYEEVVAGSSSAMTTMSAADPAGGTGGGNLDEGVKFAVTFE